MKTVHLRYHWEMDLTWALCVNVAGELVAAYLWWRIYPLSDFELNLIILSVFIGYIGMSLLCLIGSIKIKEEREALLLIGEKITAQDYQGNILNDCIGWKIDRSPIQNLFGIGDLYLVDKFDNKIKIRNVSVQVSRYLMPTK